MIIYHQKYQLYQHLLYKEQFLLPLEKWEKIIGQEPFIRLTVEFGSMMKTLKII